MNPEPASATTVAADAAESAAPPAVVPVWLLVLLLVLLYWGMIYFDTRTNWEFNPQVYIPYRSLAELQQYQPPTGGISLDRGRAVYDQICALCHNTDGAGKPGQAPPFVGSDWVLGSPNRMIRIPLSGLNGPLQVNGQAWNLSMPAMGAALSDDDLAAVLSYMRQSWGNKAAAITPDQVKTVRAEVGNRSQPWTAELLNAVP